MNADYSGSEVSMDQIHYRVHTGKVWYTSLREVGSAPINVLVQTGANPLHIYFSMSTGAGTSFDLYEAPTVTANGTPWTIFNHNRTSSLTTLSTMYTGCTFTGGT